MASPWLISDITNIKKKWKIKTKSLWLTVTIWVCLRLTVYNTQRSQYEGYKEALMIYTQKLQTR